MLFDGSALFEEVSFALSFAFFGSVIRTCAGDDKEAERDEGECC